MKITTTTRQHSRAVRKGFTLVELLVVMAILAILASISWGPITRFLDSGKITESRAMCREFKVAIQSFKKDYNRALPYSTTYPDDDELVKTDSSGLGFIGALMGSNHDVNDRGIEYLGIKTAKNGFNGIVEDSNGNVQAIVDHWGNPFHIALDYSGDGKVDPSLIDSYFDEENDQRDDAIIATPGKNKLWDEDSILSW